MQGAAVTVLDRDEGALARLRLEMASAHTYCVDVTDENAFCEALRAVRETRPTCDVLIGNAGADPRYEGLNMSLAEWEGLFRLNVSHYFLLCREMVPHMVEAGGGSIILTSSHLAWVAKPKCIAYNCTKAANIGLVRSLAEAFGDGLIRANSVAPGWTLTDRQKASVGTPADFEDCRLNSQALPLSLTPELSSEFRVYSSLTRQTDQDSPGAPRAELPLPRIERLGLPPAPDTRVRHGPSQALRSRAALRWGAVETVVCAVSSLV
eukprot:scaffold131577_cov75-Phaeocystis_antarctica.AAC.1